MTGTSNKFNPADLWRFPVVKTSACEHCHDHDGEIRMICGRPQHVACFQKMIDQSIPKGIDE